MGKILKTIIDLLIGTENDVASYKPHKINRKSIAKALKQPTPGVTERGLIQAESEIGATIFGMVPEGGRREFFNLDPSTWIYYDEWVNEQTGQLQNLTLRYEVHHNGILKVKEGARYEFIHGQELDNFVRAVENYYQLVNEQVYSAPVLAS